MNREFIDQQTSAHHHLQLRVEVDHLKAPGAQGGPRPQLPRVADHNGARVILLGRQRAEISG